MSTVIRTLFVFVLSLICCSAAEGLQFGTDVQFIPSDSNTTIVMNCNVNMTEFTITNESIYFNGYNLQFMTTDSGATVWLDKWQPPNVKLDIATTENVNISLGQSNPGKKYHLFIDGAYQNILCDDGILNFSVSSSASIYTRGQYDLDGNGIVGVLDIAKVGWHYGEQGDNGWCIEDINDDGMIDDYDLSAIVPKYGCSE
jgi:hypothetical protein